MLVTRAKPLLAALIMVGCATDPGAELFDQDVSLGSIAVDLELQIPEHGFQLETLGMLIEAGDDIRWCEVVAMPGEPDEVFHVDRIESAMTPYGHDLIVSAAAVNSETAAVMEVGDRIPCTRAGEAFGEELSQITSSQHAYHDQRYPDGVGQVFRGGQKIAVDYHYFNVSDEPVAANVKLNFHLVQHGVIQRIAHTAGFHNFTIYTPPGGKSSHLAECLVSQTMVVGELVRRTQRHGTDFSVWLAGGSRDGELVWTSSDWQDSHYELDEPLVLAEGEGFRFQCDYDNNTDLELRFGLNASDEMCNLNATWWVVDDVEPARDEACLLFEVDADGVARR